jgi:hypothetical protein
MHSPVHLANGDRETAGQSFRRLGKHVAVGASALQAMAGAVTRLDATCQVLRKLPVEGVAMTQRG